MLAPFFMQQSSDWVILDGGLNAVVIRQRSRPPCASRTFVNNSVVAFLSIPQINRMSGRMAAGACLQRR
jgi:hypothetical protein